MPQRNPAVGIIREQVLTGFLLSQFGADLVEVPVDGVNRGYDVLVDGMPLQIKTRTNTGQVKVLWTADTAKIESELSDYQPSCDILLVIIHWNRHADSVFYIPLEVQMDVWDQDRSAYLTAPVRTNHRGISISSKAMKLLQGDQRTLIAKVDWRNVIGQSVFSVYERWINYWENVPQTK